MCVTISYRKWLSSRATYRAEPRPSSRNRSLSLSLSSFPLSPPGEKNVMNVREDWRAERRNKRNKKRKRKKKEEKKERKIGRRRGEYIIIRSFDRDYRRGINE